MTPHAPDVQPAEPVFLDDLSTSGMRLALRREPAADDLDLSEAVRREGWESVVLQTPAWIVRFPRHRDRDRFATELAVLDHVRGRLPVRTPEVVWTGVSTHCMTYPVITGTAFARTDWAGADPAGRQALIDSLAALLIAWGSAFGPTDAQRLAMPAHGQAPGLTEMRTVLTDVPARVRPGLETLLDRYVALYERVRAATGTTVLHGDFHLRNMVLDGPAGRVSGLWDFSCVATGLLAWDLHYLAGELADPYLDPAPPGEGDHLQLLACVLAELPDTGVSTSDQLLLADLMNAVESIGDHGPADAVRWTDWLGRL